VPLSAQLSIITTVAGDGTESVGGDGFAATSAGIGYPADIVIDSSGRLFISANGNTSALGLTGRVRRVQTNGIVDTLAILPELTVNGFPISGITSISGMTMLASNGLIYVAQNSALGDRIIQVSPDGTTAVAGNTGFNFGGFSKLLYAPNNTFFMTDAGNHRILRLTSSGPVVHAGRTGVAAFGGDGGSALQASLNTPQGLAADSQGNVYIADSQNHRVRKVDANGIITTYAGSGGPNGGFGGDGGPATSARLDTPIGLAIDGAGNLYIADSRNSRVRKVDPNGIITTIAGSGNRFDCFSSACYSGDGGPAVAAKLSSDLQGLALDSQRNLYIADSGNHRVRKVTLNAPPTQLPPPTILTSGGIGVMHGASYLPEITSGSWTMIQGLNLAPILAPGRIWTANDIVNGKLPTKLEGVSVRFNGQLGYMYFVSPTQVNVLAPDNLPLGTIQVEIETPSGKATTNAMVRSVTPALFRMAAGNVGTFYSAAVHLDGTLVAPSSVFAGARPALPGETISIYGTGFGLTSPPRPAGEVFDPAPLTLPFTVRLNGIRATAGYGGIVGPGLYQFNVTLPLTTPPLDYYNVTIEIGGVESDARMIVAAQR
jgi:uncharacterized protein (TIGR03437 family)